MRIDGSWVLIEGVLRPTLEAAVCDGDGRWHSFPFLVDTGADRTVLCYHTVAGLNLELEDTDGLHLEGAGGHAASALARTDLRLTRETGEAIRFHGPFFALTDPAALDLNLLGRDVLGRFAVIVDRPGEVVTLLTGKHGYVIRES